MSMNMQEERAGLRHGPSLETLTATGLQVRDPVRTLSQRFSHFAFAIGVRATADIICRR